jgi:hypothetical protein
MQLLRQHASATWSSRADPMSKTPATLVRRVAARDDKLFGTKSSKAETDEQTIRNAQLSSAKSKSERSHPHRNRRRTGDTLTQDRPREVRERKAGKQWRGRSAARTIGTVLGGRRRNRQHGESRRLIDSLGSRASRAARGMEFICTGQRVRG